MNLKLPSTVLEVLPTKCSNRSGLAAAIQENVCWVARISAVSDKVAAVWRTINMISNSTKSFYAFSVWCKTLDTAQSLNRHSTDELPCMYHRQTKADELVCLE